MGRNATGVKGITLSGDDEMVGLSLVNDDATILTITENGYGKRTKLSEYRTQGRGGQGIITIKTSKRNGKVVSSCKVTDQDELMLITQNGMIIRIKVADISVIGRNTQGVRLFDLRQGDKVMAVANFAEKEEEEELEELEDNSSLEKDEKEPEPEM